MQTRPQVIWGVGVRVRVRSKRIAKLMQRTWRV
jgi:hypothetical protein